MTPEQIGRVGELKFDTFCNEAGIVCSAQHPDLLGIDRYLEFSPPEVSPFISLDARASALSCYVQIKTISSSQTTWRLSLAVTERLSKSVKPAFVILFKLDEHHSVTWGGLVHLRGKLIERTLTRLRKAQKDGKTNINHLHLSLTEKDAIAFPIDSGPVRLIAKSIGPNMASYSREKELELASVGFGKDRIVANISYGDIDIEALVDAYLNELPIPIEEMSVFENRFNIKLPFGMGKITKGTMTVGPAVRDGCTFSIKSLDTGRTVKLPCSLQYTAIPNLPIQHLRFRILTAVTSYTLGSALEFTSKTPFDEKNLQTLETWQREFEAIHLLHQGKCELMLTSPDVSKDISFGFTELTRHADVGQLNSFRRTVNAARWLVEEMRIADEPVSLFSLMAGNEDIRAAYMIMAEVGGFSPLSYSVSEDGLDDHLEEVPFLYISSFQIGEKLFGYAARTVCKRKEKSRTWESTGLIPVIAKQLSSEPFQESYLEFGRQTQRMTGISSVVLRDLAGDEEIPASTLPPDN